MFLGGGGVVEGFCWEGRRRDGELSWKGVAFGGERVGSLGWDWEGER